MKGRKTKKMKMLIKHYEQLLKDQKRLSMDETDNYHSGRVIQLQSVISDLKLFSNKPFDHITKAIQDWAIDKDIDKATLTQQFMKLTEEVGELSSAINKNQVNNIANEMADIMIVMIGMHLIQNIDLVNNLCRAYNKIVSRKGTNIKGMFVKEEDLNV